MWITFVLNECCEALTYGIAGFDGDRQCTPIILVYAGKQRIQLSDSSYIKVFIVCNCTSFIPLQNIPVNDCDVVTFTAKLVTDFCISEGREMKTKHSGCCKGCKNCH